jgi:hypothetical protein
MELSSYGSGATNGMEYEKANHWIQTQTWIIWYRYTGRDWNNVIPVWSSATNSTTTPLSRVGYDVRETSDLNPYGRKFVEGNELPSHGLQISPPKLPGIDPTLRQYILHFFTLSVKFSIRSSNAYLRYGSVDPAWKPRGRVVFLLTNRKNAVCGYVLLDDTWESLAPNGSTTSIGALEPLHEFILLSKANYHCEWDRPHAAHPYTHSYEPEAYIEFHAMMVTWKDGVAERAGLGRIHQEALMDAWEGPEWKEILLG